MLNGASFVVSPQIILIVMCTAGLFGGALLLAPARARWPLVAAGPTFAGVNAFLAHPIPIVWLAPIALQITSILIFAAGCAALFCVPTRTFRRY